jgi:hypothetical protein
MLTYGDPRIPPRIWRKIIINAGDCWLWQGASGGSAPPHRYGVAQLDGKLRLVHRWIYDTFVAPVDRDTGRGRSKDHVHHVCETPMCVNPAHLELMTVQEHIGQWHRDKTHCPQGHEYSGANLYIKPEGWRVCRACQRERRRKKTS